jgi:hypothetical protein
MQPEESVNPPVARVALAFADALTRGDWDAAHQLLSPSAQEELPPHQLRARYEQMTSYWEHPSDSIELAEVEDEIPARARRGETDIAWAYVAIYSEGRSWQEAVIVRVVRERSREMIAEVIWGRP